MKVKSNGHELTGSDLPNQQNVCTTTRSSCIAFSSKFHFIRACICVCSRKYELTTRARALSLSLAYYFVCVRRWGIDVLVLIRRQHVQFYILAEKVYS